MRLFRRWTKDQCLSAIEEIEMNLAAGVNSLSHPTQGAMSYNSADEAIKILAHLEARIDEIDGVKTSRNPIRRGGYYGVRPW